MYAKAHWGCSGGLSWPNTLLTHFTLVFPLTAYPTPVNERPLGMCSVTLQQCTASFQAPTLWEGFSSGIGHRSSRPVHGETLLISHNQEWRGRLGFHAVVEVVTFKYNHESNMYKQIKGLIWPKLKTTPPPPQPQLYSMSPELFVSLVFHWS